MNYRNVGTTGPLRRAPESPAVIVWVLSGCHGYKRANGVLESSAAKSGRTTLRLIRLLSAISFGQSSFTTRDSIFGGRNLLEEPHRSRHWTGRFLPRCWVSL